MSYLQYLYAWVTKHGFVSKAPRYKFYDGTYSTDASGYYEFLTPKEFYAERAQLDLWRQAAKERKRLSNIYFSLEQAQKLQAITTKERANRRLPRISHLVNK